MTQGNVMALQHLVQLLSGDPATAGLNSGVAVVLEEHHRKLIAASSVCCGATLASTPWSTALSAETAHRSLERYETAGKGLLPGGLASLTALLRAPAPDLLPEASAWVLLLALGLLCEMRDPRSRWAPYVAMLPAPPGSRLAAVCSAGPPATDLLLFSAEELAELQSAPFAAAVKAERARLARLHAHLFGEAEGARVCPASFLWAHCLVRSRALELIAAQREGAGHFRERCMLPLIDLCNHAGSASCCRLSVRLSAAGSPRAVDLVASRDIAAGEELMLNYGERPMRDLLRGYGFTPDQAARSDPAEVFEDWGDACEALLVQGSGQGRCLWLCGARVLAQPGSEAVLEMAGQASLLYLVKDEASMSLQESARGAVLAVRHPNSSPAALSGAAAAAQPDQVEAAGVDDDAHAPVAMDPATERSMCTRIVKACRAFLAAAPTSHAEDARLLEALDSERGPELGEHSSNGSSGGAGCLPMSGPAGRPQAGLQRHWQRHSHTRMAVQYRLQRKLLLCRVADDLAAQARMLS